MASDPEDPPRWWQDHQLRTWVGAGAYIGVVLALLVLLVQTNIPPESRDIVMALAGVLASGIAPAVSRFVGRRMD